MGELCSQRQTGQTAVLPALVAIKWVKDAALIVLNALHHRNVAA